MNPVPDILRILPELVFVLTGVAVMLIDASLPGAASRRFLGWVVAFGTLAALYASLFQLGLPGGAAYFASVQSDPFSVFFHVLICWIVLLVTLISLDTLPAALHHQGEYYALLALGASGMCLMTSGVELLVIFIGLEISSISTYILAGYRKHTGKSPEAALKYFLLGSFATAFFLYGVALIFGATGSTQIGAIFRSLYQAGAHTPAFAYLALAMMLAGLGFKVSAAPFQVWTPDVYEGAPSPVVALMSTAPKAAAFAVLLRVAYHAFPTLHPDWTTVLWILSAASMTVGNLAALRQQNVKRMLAYSSIAHAGYLLAAFTAFTAEGVAAAVFYTAAYAAMNVGIFAILCQVSGFEEHLPLIADYRGLIYRSPLLGGAMIVFLVSLIGIPFTGGFFGKFYVFTAAVHAGNVWLGILGLLNSGIAACYYLRLLLTSVSRPSEQLPLREIPRLGAGMITGIFLTLAATLLLGIAPGRVLLAAQRAAIQPVAAPPQPAAPASLPGPPEPGP